MLRNHFSRAVHAAGVPAALVLVAASGGAVPGAVPQAQTPLRVSLSAVSIEWGSPVTAAGGTDRSRRGASVLLSLWSRDGSRVSLGKVKVDRNGRWKARVRPASTGVVTATIGSIDRRAASARAGAAITVAPRIRVSVTGSVRAGGRTTVRGSISPRSSRRVRIEFRRAGRWIALATVTERSGRFASTLRTPSGAGRMRVAVEAGGGVSARTLAVGPQLGLRPALASWYGLYGEGLACGGVLGRDQLGVAHKTLPCGTKVTISYRGRTVVAPVIDRGPFVGAREFDLTGAVARRLHFDGVDTIWVSP